MRCVQCGHELTHFMAILAQTMTGTQCPKCWTRLRRVSRDRDDGVDTIGNPATANAKAS